MVKNKKERGVLLTVWLIIMLIANFLTMLSYLVFNSTIAAFYPSFPAWVFYLYGLLGLLNLTFVILLLLWKKWAFYGFCVSAVTAFILNMIISVGIGAAFFGLVGPVILYLIMRPKWELFE
jgi:hypothetical protein